MTCFVLGAGAFGTALASVLAEQGREVHLWCRTPERAAEVRAGENSLLPGFPLPSNITPVLPASEFAGPYELALSVVPTQHLRGVLQARMPGVPRDCPWVSASKGIEIGTQALPSEILEECLGLEDVSVLSGPSHAEEVVKGVPTAVVLGCADLEIGRTLQQILSTGAFRVYSNRDTRGVELGGALKNVMALAAGIAVGFGYGDNTLAALVTRGAVEMARLGSAMGGQERTFSGLSGMGDLIVTCFSEHSRNRSFGVRIGQGEDPESVLAEVAHVVEGFHTSKAVVAMATELGVEMPIAEEVYQIVHKGKSVERGIQDLLSRSLKDE